MAIIPCDDCKSPIDVGHLGKRRSNDKFVCNKCRKKYDDAERLLRGLSAASRAVH